jgi:glycosyltransferase involved in cell wall biosynthesis
MDLSDLLTIVIPCKNEKNIISKTLDLLNHQTKIHGVKVVVCDSSNDGMTKFQEAGNPLNQKSSRPQ